MHQAGLERILRLFLLKELVLQTMAHELLLRSPRFFDMKSLLAMCIVTVSLLAGGCATKKYVRNTTTPIQAKVDEVGDQTTKNSQQIDDTRNQVKQVDEKAQSGISAAQERASSADQHAATADQHAGDAMNKATEAAQVGDQNTQALNSLRSVVAKHDIPVYRIQMVGLGKEKPVDDAKTRAAMAKNRRVEVKVFSADQATASLDSENSANRVRQ